MGFAWIPGLEAASVDVERSIALVTIGYAAMATCGADDQHFVVAW